MSEHGHYCYDDEDVDPVAENMGDIEAVKGVSKPGGAHQT